jgi:hypothetical protein
MYSLALIIFVVYWNQADQEWSLEGFVQISVFYADRKSKMATNAILGSNVKLSPVVAAILNFIPEQKT